MDTNLSSVRVLMARPVAIRDGPRAKGPRASSNHYSLVSPSLLKMYGVVYNWFF